MKTYHLFNNITMTTVATDTVWQLLSEIKSAFKDVKNKKKKVKRTAPFSTVRSENIAIACVDVYRYPRFRKRCPKYAWPNSELGTALRTVFL